MTSTIAPVRAISAPKAAAPPGSGLRNFAFTGPAGMLEALLNEGAPDAPFAALVCHPHPLGGGTMHNKVVYHAMKALNDPKWGLGWPVLRFNFRGTGRSQGSHDGIAEAEDVQAAMDWLENEYKRPLVIAGFSFGAAMAVKGLLQPAAVPLENPRPGRSGTSHTGRRRRVPLYLSDKLLNSKTIPQRRPRSVRTRSGFGARSRLRGRAQESGARARSRSLF